MYTTLMRLYFEVAETPIDFIGLVILLMTSWALIVSVIMDMAIRIFDHPDR